MSINVSVILQFNCIGSIILEVVSVKIEARFNVFQRSQTFFLVLH